MYRVYGNSKKEGWVIIKDTESLTDAKRTANNMKSSEYYTYIIKESTHRGDIIIAREDIDCEWER